MVIKINCQKCGAFLFKYFKDKRGYLIKLFLDEIRVDKVGVRNANNGTKPTCPTCSVRLGRVTLIKGRPALKVNRSAISMRT